MLHMSYVAGYTSGDLPPGFILRAWWWWGGGGSPPYMPTLLSSSYVPYGMIMIFRREEFLSQA